MKTPRALALAAALLLLVACESPTARPTAGPVPQAKVDFVTNAYQVIQFDREQGALAQTEARDPRVKALSAQLVRQANDYAEMLGPIAADAGIRPPDVLRYDLRVRLAHMRLQRGLDFDQTYLADQIASHDEALRNAGEMRRSGGLDPRSAALLQRGEGLLQQNLATLVRLQRELGRPED